MTLPELLLTIYESDDAPAALRALAAWAPVRGAAWVRPPSEPSLVGWDAGAPDQGWLAEAPPADPERLPAAPGGEMIRVRLDTGGLLALGLNSGAGVPDGALRRIAGALDRVVERARRLREVEEERDALRQRAEESEALHVLGLSANRSLDPDEVLSAVARFSRTLLGAHYVTVNTSGDEGIAMVAAVGLREGFGADGDPLAARVTQQGRPVVVGPEEDVGVSAFPFHAAEGMRIGLGVPLSLFGTTFGALIVGYRREYRVEPRDVRLALTLAGHAAVAISNARLHRALAERSLQLERAYQELRWTTQAKERFFASMSHELRTPLNAILGYQSLLLDGVAGELQERQRRYVTNANRATNTLLHLVNDVLDLSKLEAGKLELVARPCQLSRVVRDTLTTIEPMAAAKGIHVRVTPETALPELVTDEDRVRQILLNLLSNAVKFTEHGEIVVSAELETGRSSDLPEGTTASKEWVEIRVSDTGSGIEPADQERIFHEFEQVMGAGSRGGTGLGLPISRKLARLLGGELQVESELGIGSTFVLRLPLHPQTDGGTWVA